MTTPETLRAVERLYHDGATAPDYTTECDAHAIVGRFLDEVKPEAVRWLWKLRIPLGKSTIVEGDPGLGKSTLALYIAARVTRGAAMPDGTPTPAGGVVLLTAEDGLGDTVRPRLEAMGADLARVFAIEAVRDAGHELPVVLPAHLDGVRAAVHDVGALLVIVDPLAAFLDGSVNSWRDHAIRRALYPLTQLAEDLGVAVVLIRHLRKGAGSAMYRGGGSIGLIAAARSALLVATDPDDETLRVLASVKSNLGPEPPSLAFRVEDDGHGVARIAWAGKSPHCANALSALPDDDEARSALDEAVEILREALRNGSKPVREVEHLAREAGVELRTLRRARRRLGVRSSPDGFGGPRLLSLPDSQPSGVDQTPISVVSDDPSQNRGNTDNTEVNTGGEKDPAVEQHLREAIRGRPDLDRDALLAQVPYADQPAAAPVLDRLLAELRPEAHQ